MDSCDELAGGGRIRQQQIEWRKGNEKCSPCGWRQWMKADEREQLEQEKEEAQAECSEVGWLCGVRRKGTKVERITAPPRRW